MKKIYLWLIYILPTLALAQSPCDNTQVTLESQADVDSFPTRFCSTLCSLTVSGSDITNLDSLYVIEKVGRLVIQYNPVLTDITGLSNLVSVENSCSLAGVVIDGNNLLADLNGLNSLVSVVGTLEISSNTMLANIDALSNLTSVSGGDLFSGITIESNASLENVDGLSGLSTLGTSLAIRGNPALANLEGVSGLTRIDGSLDVTGNDALASLNGLRSVTRVGYFVTIDSNPLIANLQGLNNINHIGQWDVAGMSLTITNNAMLASLDGLQGLDSIPGVLRIEGNESLLDLNGLSSLISMDRPFGDSYNSGIRIANNNALTDISGIDAVTSISNARACYLEIESNASLTSIAPLALNAISGAIGSSLRIAGNGSLTNIDGLKLLTKVSAGLSAVVQIMNNPSLENIDGLSALANVSSSRGGTLTITDNTDLGSFCGLYTLFHSKGIGCGSPDCYSTAQVTISGNERNPTPEEIEAEGPCDATVSQPTNIVFSNVTSNGMRVKFNKASTFTSGYLVLMQAYGQSAPEVVPQDGVTYHVGQVLGSSSIVVSVSSDTTFVVSGLVPSTPYYFDVFSWRSTENGNDYLTVNPLQGHQSTAGEATVASNVSFTDVSDESMTVMLDQPQQGNYIAFMKAFGYPSPGDVPEDGTEYHVGGTLGSSTIVVNIGDGSAFTVNGLMPDVTYYFDIYRYDPSTFTYEPGPGQGSQATAPGNENLRAYPNPFDVTTTIPFVVSQEDAAVQVSIFDSMGREVNVLAAGNFEAGRHEATWDGYDKFGRRVTAGVYIYSVKSEKGVVTGRVSVR